MKKLSICVTMLIVLLSLSVVTPTTVVSTLPSCVTIHDLLGDAIGAGFVIAPGYVVTAKHVTEDEPIVFVKLFQIKEARMPTKVIQVPGKDLVILKVDTGMCSAINLGNSDDIEPGEEVFAVGAPLGQEESVTKGIISSYNRKTMNVDTTHYDKLIQSVNVVYPGDSGGPLVNSNGQVLGINVTAVRGGPLGFSIPINQVREAILALIRADQQPAPAMPGIVQSP